jgi:hypothetical protein
VTLTGNKKTLALVVTDTAVEEILTSKKAAKADLGF